MLLGGGENDRADNRNIFKGRFIKLNFEMKTTGRPQTDACVTFMNNFDFFLDGISSKKPAAKHKHSET